ncbi:MAG: DNA/RNA nuclease SfsA [Firmicutes bacterium]|nr:DNA/RNA nuclease SfsA [Bacillota bacterium]
MIYHAICSGVFISRPNRFVAEVLLDGRTEICHVKNTGRCKELLIPGAKVYLCPSSNPNRATKYDLVAIEKGERLVNLDSQAPNKALGEYVQSGQYIEGVTLIKPEAKYGRSRFDFYVEAGRRKIFIEVKGVTLEEDGVAMFPDAPTERGVKHLHELAACIGDGYEAQVIFVIQMSGVRYFTPNNATDQAFGQALAAAEAAGVQVAALDCTVTEQSMVIKGAVPVKL